MNEYFNNDKDKCGETTITQTDIGDNNNFCKHLTLMVLYHSPWSLARASLCLWYLLELFHSNLCPDLIEMVIIITTTTNTATISRER